VFLEREWAERKGHEAGSTTNKLGHPPSGCLPDACDKGEPELPIGRKLPPSLPADLPTVHQDTYAPATPAPLDEVARVTELSVNGNTANKQLAWGRRNVGPATRPAVRVLDIADEDGPGATFEDYFTGT
jgi:hypothetical protein